MAQPASRTDLINYCKRQLGAPVLEINVADEQVDDLVDDALQYFHERHFDGVEQTYLKYKITQADIDRGRGRGGDNPVGIVTTSAETTIVGTATTFSYEENSNYLQVPPAVIGINKIFKFDGSNTVTNNMFSVKYQLFLNDIYTFSSMEVLTYGITKRYLEDIDFLLTTEKQIRFNQRQDRLYLDLDWSSVTVDDYVIIDSPPVQPVSDTLILAQAVDHNFFIIRAEETKTGSLMSSIKKIKSVGSKIDAIVLNDVDTSKGGYGYYYNYYQNYYGKNYGKT